MFTRKISLFYGSVLKFTPHSGNNFLCVSLSSRAAKSFRKSKSSPADKDPFGKSSYYRHPKSDSPNIAIEERFKMAESQREVIAPQLFDYFLVLDFEATCDRGQTPQPQEIIEFPVLKVDSRTMETVSSFHTYVSPKVHPNLTTFCTQLTGIIQDMVEGQPNFEKVLLLFHQWMETEGLLDSSVKSAFLTCGDWDLGVMLPQEAEYFDVKLPAYFQKWINIKHSFSEAVGHYPRGLMLMLESLDIEHTGREHSGIDDCKNILKIARRLANRGYTFRTTGERKDKFRALYKM